MGKTRFGRGLDYFRDGTCASHRAEGDADRHVTVRWVTGWNTGNDGRACVDRYGELTEFFRE